MSEQQDLLNDRSLVHIYEFNDTPSHRCGYCNKDGAISNGMTSNQLQIHDYQELIDRGWRRSGTYLYKPLMKQTCCPLYTIKCDALTIELKKSQKNVLRNMKNFMEKGIESKEKKCESLKSETSQPPHLKTRRVQSGPTKADYVKQAILDGKSIEELSLKLKSKQKRLYKKLKRSSCTSMDAIERSLKKRNNLAISLEDRLKIDLNKSINKLEVTLIRSWPPTKEFLKTFKEEHEVYAKYQMKIHDDAQIQCNLEQFKRFLCTSPLISNANTHCALPIGYGSFHQQYRLNGKLLAVGVLDILSNCVSSVYFFYDPEYAFLNLGTYSALTEISLVRTLNKQDSNIKWYYLGYYVNDCRKMKYKGQYYPSYLACPEVFTWHALEQCLPLIASSKYSRFNQDPLAKDEDDNFDLDNILIQIKTNSSSTQLFKYKDLLTIVNKSYVKILKNQIRGYCNLFGKKVSNRIIIRI